MESQSEMIPIQPSDPRMESPPEMIPISPSDPRMESPPEMIPNKETESGGNSAPESSIQNTIMISTLNQEVDSAYDDLKGSHPEFPPKDDTMLKKPTETSLPEDIIYTILLKLPVKTLIRFQSVSKSWYSLISLPSFKHDHYLLHTKQDPLPLLMRYDNFDEVSGTTTLHIFTHDSNQCTSIDSFSLTVPQAKFTFPIIVQSCQGLLSICDIYDENIFICNPATRQIIALPLPMYHNDTLGFGYAVTTNEFKVVGFFNPDHTETKCYCMVFTLGTSGWRDAKPPPYQGVYCCNAPFLHGALHLLPLPFQPSLDNCIYAFDIQREEYTSIPLPESYLTAILSENFKYMYLTDFRGSLCLVYLFIDALELWLLKDYNNREWVKESTIDLASLGSDVTGEALASMGGGSILMKIGLGVKVGIGMHKESLYSYNPENKTFTLLAEERYSAALHMESFLSPQDLCKPSH